MVWLLTSAEQKLSNLSRQSYQAMIKTPWRCVQCQTRYAYSQTSTQALRTACSHMPRKCLWPFVLMLLPENAADCRQAVKYWGDVLEGVVTQCVVSISLHAPSSQRPHSSLSLVQRSPKWVDANDQYYNNVALK